MWKLIACLLVVGFMSFYSFVKTTSKKDAKPLPASVFKKENPRLEREAIITYSEELFQPKYRSVRRVTVTGYSSSPDETDDTSFETANGEHVQWGGCAVNGLPFGTLLEIPDLYPGTVFMVNDRKNSRYDSSWMDIWFPSKRSALDFGVRTAEARILNPACSENNKVFAWAEKRRVLYRNTRLANKAEKQVTSRNGKS